MENTKITKGKLINYTMISNNLKVEENFNISKICDESLCD